MGRGSHRQRKHGQEELQRYIQPPRSPTYSLLSSLSMVVLLFVVGPLLMTVCCIYHKPRAFGESSDESSSSSSSDDDSSDDDDRARWTNRPRNKNHDEHNHDDNGHAENSEDLPNGGEPCAKHAHSKRVQKQQRRKRRPSPNAYERVPKHERKTEENVTNGEGGSEEKMVEDK